MKRNKRKMRKKLKQIKSRGYGEEVEEEEEVLTESAETSDLAYPDAR